MLSISLGALETFEFPQLRIPCLALYPILIGLFDSLETNFLNYLYTLDISPLSDVGLVKIFSQFVGFHFVLLTVSFAFQKLCSFMFLEHKPLVFCLGTFPLCPCIQDSSPLSLQ